MIRLVPHIEHAHIEYYIGYTTHLPPPRADKYDSNTDYSILTISVPMSFMVLDLNSCDKIMQIPG